MERCSISQKHLRHDIKNFFTANVCYNLYFDAELELILWQLIFLATTMKTTEVTVPKTTVTPGTVSKEITTMLTTPIPGTSSTPVVTTSGNHILEYKSAIVWALRVHIVVFVYVRCNIRMILK